MSKRTKLLFLFLLQRAYKGEVDKWREVFNIVIGMEWACIQVMSSWSLVLPGLWGVQQRLEDHISHLALGGHDQL